MPFVLSANMLLSLLVYVQLCYGTSRGDFGQLCILMGVLLALYLHVCWYIVRGRIRGRTYWALFSWAVLFRFALVFAIPVLTDDFYRFVWDGRLLIGGVSPFAYTPSQLVGGVSGLVLPNGIGLPLYECLNSPDYYTVYPPLCQGIFALAAWLFPLNMYGAVVVMKCFIWLCEVLSLVLLHRLARLWGLSAAVVVLLYALFPPAVVELAGNLHFEAAMITGLLATLHCLALWVRNPARYTPLFFAGLAMAWAVCAKLLPLLFVPLLFVWCWHKSKGFVFRLKTLIAFGFGIMLGIGGAFGIFLNADMLGALQKSTTLYFQYFEFNASIYYTLRALGYILVGYNLITFVGKLLAIGVMVFTCWLSWQYRTVEVQQLPRAMMFILTGYFVLSPVVHPWYLMPIVALSVFTPVRYPFVWSALSVLSYHAYTQMPYKENLHVTAFLYITSFVFALATFSCRRIRHLSDTGLERTNSRLGTT